METANKTAPLKATGLFTRDSNFWDGDVADATARRSVGMQKASRSRCERTIGTKIEVAFRTPAEEEPVDSYRSQAVKRWWALSTRSFREVAEPNAGRKRPSISWLRQSARFAFFLSACFWRY